ncbi:hypothetical protein H0H87_007418 [Tephrocybe sp. NHM501043]|nr:hypothetical protein H0H87_007418 [Tephrocybe sp. NHM501043]
MHAMLRIKDDKHVEIPDNDQLARVEKRLSGVKSNVEERMGNLQQHLLTRTIALETIIKGQVQEKIYELSTAVGAHSAIVQEHFEALEGSFTSLERLLEQCGLGHCSRHGHNNTTRPRHLRTSTAIDSMQLRADIPHVSTVTRVVEQDKFYVMSLLMREPQSPNRPYRAQGELQFVYV